MPLTRREALALAAGTTAAAVPWLDRAAALTPTAVVDPCAPTGTWLSGATSGESVASGAFGTFRGEPATYARTWADVSLDAMLNIWTIAPYRNANWAGTLDIATGGPRDGHTWASAATGSMDTTWQGICRKIHASWWSNLRGVHLSLAHEFNGNWYPWSVNSGNLAAFKTAWRRWQKIVQAELIAKGRPVKLVLSYNYGTNSDISAQAMNPGIALFDIVGVDFYNGWWGSEAGGLNTQALWDANLDATQNGPKGIRAWFTYAASLGKQVSFPEWGANAGVIVDAPLFIANMRNYFASHAAQLAGEAYFNLWPQCQLYPSTNIPRSRDAYVAARWGR